MPTLEKKRSIHDIARELKVSATAISFVLNGRNPHKISEPVRKKILDYVQQTGYRPNLVAQNLRTGKSGIIGMLVEDISDPFFSSIARAIEAQAYNLGYKIFFSSTENSTQKTEVLINALRDRQVDAYIIAPPPGIEKTIKALMDDDFPVIMFDRYFPELASDNIVVDNFGGSYQAIQHLFENGYSTIGFVTLDSKQTQMCDRLKGYVKGMNEHNLDHFILRISYNQKQINAADKIKAFLEKHPNIDAVLFATNYLAISGLEAVSQMKLSIPENIAVVSFDDNSHFNLFTPSITAVAQPIEKISEKVIEQLEMNLNEEVKSSDKGTIVLPTHLIIRDSSVSLSSNRRSRKTV